MITVTGPSYLDVLMRVPHLAGEGEKVRGHVVRESPGGGAMNTAAWLAAEGATVRLVTPRASDSEGLMLKDACDAVGLHVHWVMCDRTARALVLVPHGGERTIYTGHSAPPSDAEIVAAVGDAPGITWSSWRDADLRAAAAVNATLRATDTRAIADDAAAGHRWDLYIGSAAENPGGVGDDMLEATGARWCVLTEGANGGRAWDAEHGWRRYEPVSVPQVVDTCGAGDSFNAGVLMGVAAGDDIIDACARGAAVAAQCLSHAGSFPMPRP